MKIEKKDGFTDTERFLSKLCENTFLKLWSYPNPIKDDGDEFCDLLAVFEDNVYIFFDRESKILNNAGDIDVIWKRWKKKVVDKQIKTANGAAAYLLRGGKLYLDTERKIEFPIKYSAKHSNIYKFIVAHGAEKACKDFSPDNINGSLAIVYSNHDDHLDVPYMIKLDRDNPVHVFDSFSLPILLNELDTVFDFTEYIKAKNEAIRKYELYYCGEEDFLAHYYRNYDDNLNKHFIGYLEEIADAIMIEEGAWEDFKNHKQYLLKKNKDRISYMWDELIQSTSQNALDGTLLGGDPLVTGKSAIHEMAKEPRFHRRFLSENMSRVINEFPVTRNKIMRHVSVMPSFYKNKTYVFLQLEVKDVVDFDGDYRTKRAKMLEVACGVVKNNNPHLELIVGIAIYPPKLTEYNSEDLLLLDCRSWSDELRLYYEKENELLGFFKSNSIRMTKKDCKEFPDIDENDERKIGRNDRCPCGSGKKYKYCCMA